MANLENRSAVVHKFLDKVAGEKEAKYAGKTAYSFKPLVFTAGGLMGKETAEVMDSWKALVPSFHILTQQLSVALLRAKVSNLVW